MRVVKTHIPVLRWVVHPSTIIVLQETETVENVDHKADGWELHIDPST